MLQRIYKKNFVFGGVTKCMLNSCTFIYSNDYVTDSNEHTNTGA